MGLGTSYGNPLKIAAKYWKKKADRFTEGFRRPEASSGNRAESVQLDATSAASDAGGMAPPATSARKAPARGANSDAPVSAARAARNKRLMRGKGRG